ncbi:MAG: hypothetical protein ACXITR_00540 [Cyanobacterium sp.]
MQTINGKLIIEPSEDSQKLEQKFSDILVKSENLEHTLNQQHHHIESLKKTINQLESKNLSTIQKDIRLLKSNIDRQFLTVNVTMILGFLVIGIILISQQKANYQSDNNLTTPPTNFVVNH